MGDSVETTSDNDDRERSGVESDPDSYSLTSVLTHLSKSVQEFAELEWDGNGKDVGGGGESKSGTRPGAGAAAEGTDSDSAWWEGAPQPGFEQGARSSGSGSGSDGAGYVYGMGYGMEAALEYDYDSIPALSDDEALLRISNWGFDGKT